MKIGDEVYVHGYVDEIRKDTLIIRNKGGYFETIPSEVEYDCDACRHWWKSEEVCLLDDCHYEPETEPKMIPIKKTMTGSKGERIEYTEAEMVIRDEPLKMGSIKRPKTGICAKCGRDDCEQKMENIDNCNGYIEPQTEREGE